jgi:hypothetical protein
MKLKDLLNEGNYPIKDLETKADVYFENGKNKLIKSIERDLLQKSKELKGKSVTLDKAESETGNYSEDLTINVQDVKVKSYSNGSMGRRWVVYLKDESGQWWYEATH